MRQFRYSMFKKHNSISIYLWTNALHPHTLQYDNDNDNEITLF